MPLSDWSGLEKLTLEISLIADKDASLTFHLIAGFFFSGSFLSMLISTVNGAVMPLVAHYLRLDPAKVAGPLETAFQVR